MSSVCFLHFSLLFHSRRRKTRFPPSSYLKTSSPLFWSTESPIFQHYSFSLIFVSCFLTTQILMKILSYFGHLFWSNAEHNIHFGSHSKTRIYQYRIQFVSKPFFTQKFKSHSLFILKHIVGVASNV